jgi:gamma-tubulin complex component 3
MIHFVGQLQYYILFEVIESSWTELQKNIRKEDCTLDDLITAHTKYLTSITHKGLLGARRRQYQDHHPDPPHPDAPPHSTEDRNSYMIQLSELLRTMLLYRDCVDGLYSWSVSDFTHRQELDAVRTTSHLKSNRNTRTPILEDDPLLDSSSAGGVKSEFPALQERLRQLGSGFRTRLQILLGDLAYQPDVDMRFLGVSMNFNDVYQPVRRKSKVGGGASAGGASTVKA